TNNTSCAEDANGALTATIDGDPNNYRLNWYRGNPNQAYKLDEDRTYLSDLESGEYMLTITDLRTGCTSAPATTTIVDELTYPEFEIDIQPASCEQTDGLAQIVVENGPVAKVIWDTHVGIVEGNEIFELPVGSYSVTVVFETGCSTTKDFTVG